MTNQENLEGITTVKMEMHNIKKTNDLSLFDVKSDLDEMELKQNLISLASENEKLKTAISKNENKLRILNHSNVEKERIINQLIEENTKLKTAPPDRINENNNGAITDLSTPNPKNKNISQNLQQSISVLNDKINTMNTELINKDNEIDFLNSKLEESSLKKDILNKKIIKKDEKTSELINKNKNLKKKLINRNNRIKVLKNNISLEYSNIADILNSKIDKNKKTISDKNNEINSLKGKVSSLNNEINTLTDKNSNLNNEINTLNDEIENNHLEIQYLKNETILKKLSNPLAYIYLIFKSSPKELSINLKLYKTIKNRKCFDIGFYLNNNKDIQNSKWCKYFSPQLHYVCCGFEEKRIFSEKYFNTNSKKELLEDILNSQ